ncbi:MAG: glycoside hydrolase family 43 protein [Vicinamibacterales bacterium]|nr:glycoside hydrolase family 43 protein [Vicinamibacterales bacterium]
MGRPTPRRGRRVLPLVLAGVVLLALAVALAEPRGGGPWVFSYFLDNGQDGMHLAHSRDGLTWTALGGGRPFLAPTVGGKLIRDPCIILGPDNVFHAVWTTGWYEQGIGIAHSKDLITWSEAAFLPVMVHERKAVNAWAPEIFFDDETGQYLIFWATTIPGRFPATDESGSVNKAGIALNHRIYRTTTRDFKDYSRAELFLDPGFNVIDATIARDGSRYLMFLKDETLRPEARKDIRLAVADHALGPYVVGPEPISKNNWVEGPTAFRAGQDLFVLFDAYTRKRYEGVRSRDLKAWAALGAELEMPPGARHGSVVAVPEKILKGLLAVEPAGAAAVQKNGVQ